MRYGKQLVVAAVIEHQGQVLLAQRATPADLAGRWEFPGGKVEPGETAPDALVREIREELGCEVSVGEELIHADGVWPVDDRFEMRVFRASLTSGVPVEGPGHQKLRWFLPGDVPAVDLLPADVPVAGLLAFGPQTAQRTGPRRPVAILNPAAKGFERTVALLNAEARRMGCPLPVVLRTTREDFGRAQANRALALGADLVIAGGGDGTVRAVASQLRGTGVEMAVIPLGTANIFARNLGLSPHRLERAVEVALSGRAQAVDLGVARFRTELEPTRDSQDHLFLVLAGLGHDAETVLTTRPGLKRCLGWGAYFESGARHLVRPPVRMMVRVDGNQPQSRAVWTFLVGNAGRIPPGIEIFPEARLDDGRLRTMEARVTQLWQWAPVAWAGLRGHARSGMLVHGSATRLSLEPEVPTALQLDGDVFGPVVDVEFTVDPQALSVRCPSPDRQETA